MDEYINRELLKKRFKKRLDWLKKDIHDEYSGALYDGCEVDTGLIDEIPAADVAPVVRCRDCKYLVRATVNSNGFLICNVSDMEIMLEDFCSYGEKMDRGEKSG